jgi:rfaE bifunctional protein kinase chain/domain
MSGSMNSLAERFRGAKVLVIGDVMLDEYVVGVVSRISPEAPVPVLDVHSRYSSAGGAANVAMNVAGLGATVHLAGVAGQDSAGRSLRELLRTSGISGKYLIDCAPRGTISKMRIVAGQQQICRIDHEDRTDLDPHLLSALMESTRAAMEDSAVVVLSDYAKGTMTAHLCEQAIQHARTLSKPVIVDPKSKDFRKYQGCSVITPNLAEAAAASGITIDSLQALEQAGRALITQLPGTRVLITRGADGMALFEQNSPMFTVPAVARKVFDVVGAGDTVVATIAVALAAGFNIRESIEWANRAAGIVVEKPGTATVSVEELQ